MQKATTPPLTSREQARFLNNQIERLQQAYRYCTQGACRERPLPAQLAAARRRIRKWEHAESKRRDALRKRIKKAIDEAKRAVLFDPPRRAMRSVQQCEKAIKHILYPKQARRGHRKTSRA